MAELDIIASELLKSANEADKNYAKTRDQSQKDKATRLRVIVQNLKTLTLGASDLNGLSDVTLTGVTNGQILLYDGATEQWINGSAGGGGDMLKSTYDVDNTGVVDNAEAISIIGRNSTGATLYRGTIVYISGSTGNRPNFAKAQANAEATSAGTFGVVRDDIANNADGFVTTLGYLDNLDTRTVATHPFTDVTLADGDTVYLHPTVAGYITNVKPSAPNHIVYVGKVTRTSPTNGTIVYRIQNGYELDEIHDVAISSKANNDLLTYESASGLWKNKTFSAIFGGTPLVSIPTLDQVTTAGNTTTNAITVGSVNSNGNVVIGGASSSGAFQSYNGYYAFSFGTSVSAYNPNNNYTRIHMGASITYTDNFSGNFLWRSAGASVFEVANASVNFWNTSSVIVTKHNASTGNFLIGTTTDAGYKLDVNGTARTSQLHTFSQGTYLDALSSNYFYTADTGSGTYGGLSLKNSINNYNGLIYTGRSGANNAIVFQHTTYSGTPTSDGSQVFTQTYTTFGRFNNGVYGHTLYIHQRSGGVATYPLVISNGINTTNSGVGILMQTADSTGSVSVNHASIVSWKQNLTSPNVTSDMRFSTISDAANTLSEKMRISSAGNLLVGTTTDGTAKLTVAGSVTAASALARGVYFNNTLVQAAASDVLTAFQVTPTFTVDPTLLHNAYWMRFTGAYSPAAYNNPNNNATTIDLSNSFTNTFNAVGLRIRHTYSNVQNGYGILLESAGFIGIAQTSTTAQNYFAGITSIGSTDTNANPATLNVINGTNGGIKVGNLAGNSEHLIISHSQAGATSSSIRNTYNSTSAVMLIDVAAQGNLRLFGTGNVTVGSATDAGYKLDVNGSSRVKGLDNSSSTTAFLVQNTGGWDNLKVTNDGQVSIGGDGLTTFPLLVYGNSGLQIRVGNGLFSYNSVRTIRFLNSNNGIPLNHEIVNQVSSTDNSNYVYFRNQTIQTAGSNAPFIGISIETPVNTQTGAIVTQLSITPTYNLQANTTSASIQRGIYYNPTITTLQTAIHRAIETTSGDVIFNGGNVGVGTSNPSYKFHIASSAAANVFGTVQSTNPNGTAAWVAFNDQSDNVVYRVFGSGASGTQLGVALSRSASLMANLGGSGKFLIGTYSGSDVAFGAGDQERMRIVNSTGNVLVGTTTDAGNKLEVSGTLNAVDFKVGGVPGWSGIITIPTMPPITITVNSGIITNVM